MCSQEACKSWNPAACYRIRIWFPIPTLILKFLEFPPLDRLFCHSPSFLRKQGWVIWRSKIPTMKLQIAILVISFAFLTASCQQHASGKKEQALARIDSLEKIITSDPDVIKNMKPANELIKQMEAYAQAFPQDSLVPEMLVKAGEIARGLGKYDKATELLKSVWTHYGEHRLAPPALFLQAFTYDNDLRDSTMAVRYYQEFLKRYPDHELAGQVRQLVNVVGKSPEELIKLYKNQNREEQ
ncbi:MAG: hypothetical protein D6816_01515 [Bacteroidetes bacterium]|nr:MAG: hypothetical protein D6816_01515 [Bacteroidota bacterium]